MDFRGVLVLALVGASGLVALGTSSCSSADPSTINFEAKPKQQDIVGDAATSSGGSSGSSGSSGGGDGGSSSGDAGAEGGGPVTAFTGAAAYNATAAGMQATTSNNMNGSHASFNAQNNPAGQPCLDCHKTGGGGNAFAIGGTVFTTAAGATPFTANAEVRIVDAAGKLVLSAYSDSLGNVYADPVTPAIAAGASVGVRNGTTVKLMNTKLTGPGDGNCNNSACHAAGGAAGGRVFLQ